MRNCFLLSLLMFSMPTFAMFCPTNFKNIDYGNTLEFVLEECGNPTTQYKYEKPLNLAQSWDYYLKTHPFDSATTKLQVLFKDNKVVNLQITDNNAANAEVCESTEFSIGKPKAMQTTCYKPMNFGARNVSSTPLCGVIISVGDNSQAVEAACGKPALVNQLEQPTPQTPPASLIALKYEGPNPATLVFENGRLIERIS